MMSDQPPPPNDDQMPELPQRIREWINKKARGYHARKSSSKTVAQYRAWLEYSAAERLEIALQHDLSDEVAENICFQSLGKSNAVFHAQISQALREREIRLAADRDVHKARADAQEPLIDQLKEDRDQMRKFMTGFGGMMEKMMERIENIAQLQINQQPKPDEPKNEGR